MVIAAHRVVIAAHQAETIMANITIKHLRGLPA
jgi:hypothetical protein